jgi:hypothetical protein
MMIIIIIIGAIYDSREVTAIMIYSLNFGTWHKSISIMRRGGKSAQSLSASMKLSGNIERCVDGREAEKKWAHIVSAVAAKFRHAHMSNLLNRSEDLE